MTALALKIEHRIDHMFEDARTCDGAIFGDMADEKGREAALFCRDDDRPGRLTHLRDAAGRRWQCRSKNRLNRINDQNGGLKLFDLLEYPFERRFTQNQQV